MSISERSRQSARECRARKKLRYQYLEELVTDREKAVLSLRVELEKVSVPFGWGRKYQRFTYIFFCGVVTFQYRQFAQELDAGRFPEGMQEVLEEVGALKQEWLKRFEFLPSSAWCFFYFIFC